MAILDKWTLDFVSHSVTQTGRLGVRLGELLQPRDLICLSGELGAGKTALARGIARGWGAAVRVTSPTFALVNQYPRLIDGRILYHIDCYRLETLADAITMGLEDILASDGAIMIEWPERIEKMLPPDRLTITMRYESETRRNLRVQAVNGRSAALFEAFKRSAFGIS
jgi:tRNA threonylcarbamoyladenosine biosynthesis protein TsaE